MKHLILGTAGHIDHGKTALVKALTGIECDTHSEEKRRGITINLGFAHLDLPGGDSLGIVDVPGHKNFVHTMVAGASGIDMACLVVAADGGVMPQTREHLEIMGLLGLKAGVVALTKVDIAEPDIVEMAHEEVHELVQGTFLAQAPIISVSSKTGEGIDELLAALDACAATTVERPRGEVFRMFVDRIFSVAGFGTVVTGSVLGGALRTGSTAYLLPTGKELRVRRLERHGREVDEVWAGDRASVNLVGLHREDFERGMVVADRVLRATPLIDARLRLFERVRPLGVWSRGVFLTGTHEAQARVHVIDRDRLVGGETGLVQIHLPAPCVVQAGDRFVLRSTSSDVTLGGGEIIDPAPLHHRRRPPELVDHLRRIADGRLPELVASEVRKRTQAVGEATLASDLNVAESEIRATIDAGLPGDIEVLESDGRRYLVTRREYTRLTEGILKAVAAYHRRNPLDEAGRTAEELAGMLGVDAGGDSGVAIRALLRVMAQTGRLRSVGHTFVLADHHVTIDPELRRRIDAVEGYLRGCGMQTPLQPELGEVAKRERVDEATLNRILRYLTAKGVVHLVDGSYIHASVVDPVRTKLLRELAASPDGMTVAQFRDLIGGNRKICLLLYSLFDREGVTERQGDRRVITDAGRGRAGQVSCSKP